jgi:hypothetical protein
VAVDDGKTTSVDLFWKLTGNGPDRVVSNQELAVMHPYAVPFCTCGHLPWERNVSAREFVPCEQKFAGDFVKSEDCKAVMQFDATHPSIIGHKVLGDLIAYRVEVELAKMRDDSELEHPLHPDASGSRFDNTKLPPFYGMLADAEDTHLAATRPPLGARCVFCELCCRFLVSQTNQNDHMCLCVCVSVKYHAPLCSQLEVLRCGSS